MRRFAVPSALTLIFCALSLGACQTTGVATKPEGSLVEQQLAVSATRIAAAFERLARIEQARSPAMSPSVDPSLAPDSLRKPVTWEWTGPVEPALRSLADKIGYRVLVHRVPPAVPVIVRLSAADRPIVQLFEEIALQGAGRVDIRVDAYRSVIDLYYAAGA